ncbi:LysM peptidoglycan-binding domain-containing protein [Cellulomonas cellasea]|uniref:LysM peptidoglycan-binding domain-containing protein n=1 Tax=Cellulomonas cellasea TaxID=43670 RepID=UPI0025A4C8E6|nr:LysM peptidoglycan-binding domain-containing protein [Cellulomonas cellasea]MDM8085807.1 LysM peptidoglycan-binding domain-containing protein [Cellulomonas cellasea]
MSTIAIGPVANHGGAVVIPFPARRPQASARLAAQRPQAEASQRRPAAVARPQQAVAHGMRGAEHSAAPLRLTARGRRVVALLSLMLVTAFALIGTKAVAGGPQRALEVETYTVAAGDTLWALATELAAPGEDVRDVILELVELNGGGGAGLTAGQRILLPVER